MERNVVVAVQSSKVNNPMSSPKEPEEEMESKFNELTKTMDGQYRPKLRLLFREAKSQGAREALAICCDECKSKVKI